MFKFLRKLFGIQPRKGVLKGVLIRYSDKIREGTVITETATHFLVRLCNYPFESDFWRPKDDSTIVEVFTE